MSRGSSAVARACALFDRPVVAVGVLALALFPRIWAAVDAGVRDPDVWWIAAAGRWMLEHHDVPRTNWFSFTAPDHPWVMHEWLFAIPYAIGLAEFGPGFFVAVPVLALGAAGALLTIATLGRTRRRSGGVLLAAVAFLGFSVRLSTARPTGIAALFALALWCVASSRPFGTMHAIALAAIELAWANAHGSFPLGWILAGAAAFDANAVAPSGTGSTNEARARWAAVFSSVVVTAANPYGLGLHALVLEYSIGTTGAPAAVHRHLLEFRSLPAVAGTDIAPWPTVGVLAIVALLAMRGLWMAGARARGGAVLLLVAMAIQHVRHLELAGLLGCALLIPVVDDLVARACSRIDGAERPAPSTNASRMALAVFAITSAAGLAVITVDARGRGLADWTIRAPDLGGPRLAELLQRVPEGASLYAPFLASGRVIWLGAPRGIRVFYDPRNDCYPEAISSVAFRIEVGEIEPDEARAVLERAGTTHALVVEGSTAERALAGHWRLDAPAPGPGTLRLYERR